MENWRKQDKPLFKDLEWNFPEQKSNKLTLVGGNAQSFSAVVKSAEYLSANYPIKTVEIYLPDALKSKLPPLPGLNFTPSSSSGSFAKSRELNEAFSGSEFLLLPGDLSKNSATAVAIIEALKSTEAPAVLARDAVDLITPELGEIIEGHTLFFVATMAQVQKIFRSLLYPKMIMLTQPLLPTLDTLHKFTLSYPKTTIVTFHQGQIIVASQGQLITTPLEKTSYSALTLWTANLPVDLAAYNLWNPGKPLEASSTALLR